MTSSDKLKTERFSVYGKIVDRGEFFVWDRRTSGIVSPQTGEPRGATPWSLPTVEEAEAAAERLNTRTPTLNTGEAETIAVIENAEFRPMKVTIGEHIYIEQDGDMVVVGSQSRAAFLAALTSTRPEAGEEVERLREALRRCLNFIENTEGEFGNTLECGDIARAALQQEPKRHG